MTGNSYMENCSDTEEWTVTVAKVGRENFSDYLKTGGLWNIQSDMIQENQNRSIEPIIDMQCKKKGESWKDKKFYESPFLNCCKL